MSNLIEEARKLSNVKITQMPVFVHYYIKNNKIFSNHLNVHDFDGLINCTTTLEYIKKSRKLFYIYKIEENYARWCELEKDPETIQKERREKIKKINNI